MNKIVVILCFFVIFFMGPPVFAEIHGNVEFGHAFDLGLEYVDLQIEYDFPLLVFDISVFGGVQTYFQTMTLTNVNIIHAIFPIGGKIQYKDLYIKINRFCNHPTPAGHWTEQTVDQYFWTSWGTEVSVGIEW